jgi:predicted NAD/FAD-binding protein
MSFAVTDAHGDFEYASTSPNGLFAKRAHLATPWFHRMLADLVRFQREARKLLASDAHDPSLGHFLEQQRYSRDFIDRLIVPQAAAVWSADPRQMWSFPARFLVEFFDNHGMLGLTNRPKWRTVQGGSHRYVDALTRAWRDKLRLSSPVRSIARHADHVEITATGEPERYDHVIVATHSDQALELLADPTDREHELLGAIPYQANEAVLHTDRTLLPRRRRAWASWNYHLLDEPTGKPTVTYHMNRLQSLRAQSELCVTLNHTHAIDPDKVIRTIPYAHPVYTAEGQKAQRRHHEISGHNRTHYCGAYWGWGFHEDGVKSGERVAEALL